MDIEQIKEEYLSEIENANSLTEVNDIKNKYLSKKGKVSHETWHEGYSQLSYYEPNYFGSIFCYISYLS